MELDLSKNQIHHLPIEILELGMGIELDGKFKYNCLNLSDNPLKTPPIEIIQAGFPAIRDYFAGSKKVPLKEAKVLLVGDGGAGKTSLLKRLTKNEYDKAEPQTHGINIAEWETQAPQKGKLHVRLWDFGGQEIMHASHQFFLTKRSLYILVLDGRKEEKTEYWLKHIQSFGGNSPVLVVLLSLIHI